MGTRQRIKEARFSNPAIPISTFEALTIYCKLYLLILTIKMNTTFKVYPAIAMLAVILSCAMVSWCQICGKTAYGGSPAVEFYATTLDRTSHTQNPTRFYNDVLVQTNSNITLSCIAKEPEHSYPAWYYGTYLQPYLINWFVNSSLLQVSNCDETSRKVKTCSLSLVKISARDHGRYICQAANQLGCTYQELDLKVTFGERKSTNNDGMKKKENIRRKIKLPI